MTAVWLVVGLAPSGSPAVVSAYERWFGPAFWMLKGAVECVAFVWAARRLDLGRRLRQALTIQAIAYGLAILQSALFLPFAIGLAPSPPDWLNQPLLLSTYVLGVSGILWMPMLSFERARRWEFVLDVGASMLGVSALVATLLTTPAALRAGSVGLTFTFGGAQLLAMVALNVFVLRGVARPSPRAFWLLAAGVAGNLLVASLYLFPDVRPQAILVEMVTSLCTIWAADAFRNDPITADDATPVPLWLRAFNPLPPLATIGVVALLLRAERSHAGPQVMLLAVFLVILIVVLWLRLIISSRENMRLLAAQDRAAEQSRVAAIAQLAGGVAHWFNNLLTVVIGHAELGEHASRDRATPAVSDSFVEIRRAAERAATMTQQLLAYTGQQIRRPQPLDLAVFAADTLQHARVRLQPGITASLEYRCEGAAQGARAAESAGDGDEPLLVHGDPGQLRAVLEELLSNASRAMPGGGEIRVRVGVETVREPITNAPLLVGAGRHAVLEVLDSGTGAAPEVLASMFDPFFTTQEPASAVGLGLAAVRGIVATHGGGVTVKSEPGRGLSIALYFPLLSES